MQALFLPPWQMHISTITDNQTKAVSEIQKQFFYISEGKNNEFLVFTYIYFRRISHENKDQKDPAADVPDG